MNTTDGSLLLPLPAGYGKVYRALVNGRPGEVSNDKSGLIAARLDGETRIDLWHPTQVVLVGEAA